MIPRDIETTDQWQIRWATREGQGEICRSGTEAQVRWLAGQMVEFSPVIERRTITVGPWVDPDAPDSNVLEVDDEADE